MSEIDDRFDWDSVSEEEERDELVLLPEGEYPVKILSLEKGFYAGNKATGKLPCKVAHVMIEADGGEKGRSVFSVNFYLRESSMWLIRNFFKSLGLIKTGYKGVLPWDHAKGCTARAKLSIRSYTSNGEEHKVNDIAKWLPHQVVFEEPVAQAPATPPPAPAEEELDLPSWN